MTLVDEQHQQGKGRPKQRDEERARREAERAARDAQRLAARDGDARGRGRDRDRSSLARGNGGGDGGGRRPRASGRLTTAATHRSSTRPIRSVRPGPLHPHVCDPHVALEVGDHLMLFTIRCLYQ